MDYMDNFPKGYPVNPQEAAMYQQRQQQMMQQPRSMQPPQQYFFAPAQTGARIWVRGRDEAEKYPVAPNCAVDLWDATAHKLYTKSADASGRPFLTVLCYEEENAASDADKEKSGQEYAKKSELEAIAETVRSFGNSMQSLRDELEDMSKALYGVAGTKKKNGKKDADE